MTAEEIISGESLNVVFTKSLPDNNEKILKTIVAFANSAGGKLIIGVEDETRKIIGVDTAEVFSMMDKTTNAVSDSIEPQIAPHISFSTVEGKSIIIVEVYPGSSRPYYLKAPGKKYGTYIRAAVTTCPADPQMIHDLELQGANQSYDKTVIVGKELNMNAVMHRNYMEKACVQVCIFDDRVEITSPGLLYNGLDLKMIMEGNSRIRNTGIAEVFSRMHIVEAWGASIQRMIEGCRAHQIAPPVFEEVGNSFRVIFIRQLHDQINVPKEVRKDTPAQSERKAKIIAMLKQQPKLKMWQIADLLRCSYKTAYRCLQEMIAEGTIKHTGSRKEGRWEISSSTN